MYAGSKIIIIFGVISAVFTSFSPPYRESTISVNTKKWLHTVSDKFLSLTVDPEVLVKSENSGKAAINMAKSLSPAYLRVGGPGSDQFSFQSKNGDLDYMSNVTITASEWVLLNEMLDDAGLDLIICLNAITRLDGVWDSRNTLQLVSFSDRRGYKMDFELGYESQWTVVEGNSFPGAEMGRDVVRLRKILDAYTRYSNSIIIGPDLTRLSKSEDIAFARNYLTEAGNSLSALTLHPRFSSSLKPDDDASLEMLQMIAQLETNVWGKDVLARLSGKAPPRKSIWIAESKRKDGNPQFRDAINWLRRLGAGAKLGVQVMLAQPFPVSFHKPTSDFWMMTLHKALVGRQVLDTKLVSGNKTMLEAYSHCTQSVLKSDTTILDDTLVKYEKGAITVFGVNMGDERMRLNLKVNVKDEEIHKYILTEGRDSATGERITLFNNQKLSLSPEGELPILTPKIRKPSRSLALTLPPKSIFFIVIPDIKARTCMAPLTSFFEDTAQAAKTKTENAEEVIDTSSQETVKMPASEESNESNEVFVSFRSPMFADKSLSKLFSRKDRKPTKKVESFSNTEAEPIVKYITFSDNNWLSDFPKKIDYEASKQEPEENDDTLLASSGFTSYLPLGPETPASRREKYKIFTDAVFGRRNVTQGDKTSDYSEANYVSRSRSKRHIDLNRGKEEFAKRHEQEAKLFHENIEAFQDELNRLNRLHEAMKNKISTRVHKDNHQEKSLEATYENKDEMDIEEAPLMSINFRGKPEKKISEPNKLAVSDHINNVKVDISKTQSQKNEKFSKLGTSETKQIDDAKIINENLPSTGFDYRKMSEKKISEVPKPAIDSLNFEVKADVSKFQAQKPEKFSKTSEPKQLGDTKVITDNMPLMGINYRKIAEKKITEPTKPTIESLNNDVKAELLKVQSQNNDKLGKSKVSMKTTLDEIENESQENEKVDNSVTKDDHKRKPRALSTQDEFFLKLLLDLDLFERMEEHEKNMVPRVKTVKREITEDSRTENGIIKGLEGLKSMYDEQKDDILRILREERFNLNNLAGTRRKRSPITEDQRIKLESYWNELKEKLASRKGGDKNNEKISQGKPEKISSIRGAPEKVASVYTEPEKVSSIYAKPEKVGRSYAQPEKVGSNHKEPEVSSVKEKPEKVGRVHETPQKIDGASVDPQISSVYAHPEKAGNAHTEPEVSSIYTKPERISSVHAKPEKVSSVNEKPEKVNSIHTEPQVDAVYAKPERIGSANGKGAEEERDGSQDIIVSPIKSNHAYEKTLGEISQISREKIMQSVKEKTESLIASIKSKENELSQQTETQGESTVSSSKKRSEKSSKEDVTSSKKKSSKTSKEDVGSSKKKSDQSSKEKTGSSKKNTNKSSKEDDVLGRRRSRPRHRAPRLRASNPNESSKNNEDADSEHKVAHAHEHTEKLGNPAVAGEKEAPQTNAAVSEPHRHGNGPVSETHRHGNVAQPSANEATTANLANDVTQAGKQTPDQPNLSHHLGDSRKAAKQSREKREVSSFDQYFKYSPAARAYSDYADYLRRTQVENALENLEYKIPKAEQPHYHMQWPAKMQEVYPGYYVRAPQRHQFTSAENRLNTVSKIPVVSKPQLESEESSEYPTQRYNTEKSRDSDDPKGKTVVVQVFDEQGKKIVNEVYSSLHNYLYPTNYNKYLAHILKKPGSSEPELQNLNGDLHFEDFQSSDVELSDESSEGFAVDTQKSLQDLAGAINRIMGGKVIDDLMNSPEFSTDYSDEYSESSRFSEEGQEGNLRSKVAASESFSSGSSQLLEAPSTQKPSEISTMIPASPTTSIPIATTLMAPNSEVISIASSPCIITTQSPKEATTMTFQNQPTTLIPDVPTSPSSFTTTSSPVESTSWKNGATTSRPTEPFSFDSFKTTTPSYLAEIATLKPSNTFETTETTETIGTTSSNEINEITHPLTTTPPSPVTTENTPVYYLPFEDDSFKHMFRFKRSFPWLSDNKIDSVSKSDENSISHSNSDIEVLSKEVTKMNNEISKEEKAKESSSKKDDLVFNSVLQKHYGNMIMKVPKFLSTISPVKSNDLESSFKSFPKASVIQHIDRKYQEAKDRHNDASKNGNGRTDNEAEAAAYASFLTMLTNQLTNLISTIQGSSFFRGITAMFQM